MSSIAKRQGRSGGKGLRGKSMEVKPKANEKHYGGSKLLKTEEYRKRSSMGPEIEESKNLRIKGSKKSLKEA